MLAIAHDDPAIRLEAVRTAGALGATRFLLPITEALNDVDFDVRNQAAISLGWLEDPSAVPYLMDSFVRGNESAIAALARIGHRWSFRPLGGQLKRSVDTLLGRKWNVAWLETEERKMESTRQLFSISLALRDILRTKPSGLIVACLRHPEIHDSAFKKTLLEALAVVDGWPDNECVVSALTEVLEAEPNWPERRSVLGIVG